MALSTTATCKLQTVLGVPPRDSFIRAPVGLLKLSFLDCPDLLHGINRRGDDIVWNGVTGDVLHFSSCEDRQILHPVVIHRVVLCAMECLTIIFGQCFTSGVHQVTITMAGVAGALEPSEYSHLSFTRIQVQKFNRSKVFYSWGPSASISFPRLSGKIRVNAVRSLKHGNSHGNSFL